MSRFDRFLKGLPSVRYVKLNQPEIKYNLETNSGEFTVALMAKVIDYEDKALFDAIVKYASEQGFTDLYLIDEKFIKSAIINEIIRRKDNEQREAMWVDSHCTACGMSPIGEETWTEQGQTPPKLEYFMSFCPCCGAKMLKGDVD